VSRPPKDTDLDELLPFRPRLGGGRQPRPREDSFRSAVYRAARLTTATARATRHWNRRTRVDVRAPHPLARRVIVKAHVARMTPSGTRVAALHLRYIERDGVEREGSPGALYGPQGPLAAETFNSPRPHEKHQFRLIVSPEDGHELDLTDYVRRLMTQVQRDLGQRIEWAPTITTPGILTPTSCCAGSTATATKSASIASTSPMACAGARRRSPPRSSAFGSPKRSIEAGPRKSPGSATRPSTARSRAAKTSRQVTLRTRAGPLSPLAIFEGLLLARLAHLERLELAQRTSAGCWTLTPGWTQHIKTLGERGDILAEMHRDLRSNPAHYRIVLPGQRLEPTPADRGRGLHGRVVCKGLADELRGSFYAVLETPGGAGYRVPLDRRSAEDLRPGDLVSMVNRLQRSVRPEDRILEETATRTRGLVDLAATPSPAPDRDRLRHRLRELTKMGLARPDGTDRWRVPTDLIAQLEARDARAPRYRVDLRKDPLRLDEQVTYRGPVWLDTVRGRPLVLYGFGAEVLQALDRRDAFLRTLGIDPVDPRRLILLRDVECRALGAEIAARTGQAFLLQPPEPFHGRVELAQNRSRTPLAIVSDGSLFVLVPLTRELGAARGQRVTLGRELQLQVEAPERDFARQR